MSCDGKSTVWLTPKWHLNSGCFMSRPACHSHRVPPGRGGGQRGRGAHAKGAYEGDIAPAVALRTASCWDCLPCPRRQIAGAASSNCRQMTQKDMEGALHCNLPSVCNSVQSLLMPNKWPRCHPCSQPRVSGPGNSPFLGVIPVWQQGNTTTNKKAFCVWY